MEIRLEYDDEFSFEEIEFYDIYIDNKLLKEWYDQKSYITIQKKKREVCVFVYRESIYYKPVVEYINKMKQELNIKGYKVD